MLLWDKFFFIPKRTSSFLFVADGSTEHKRYIWETWCTLECITLALLCFWVFIVQYSNQFVSRLWNPSDESVLLTVVSNQNMHDFSPGSKWMRLPIDRNYREKLKKKPFPFDCVCVCIPLVFPIHIISNTACTAVALPNPLSQMIQLAHYTELDRVKMKEELTKNHH